MSLRGAPGALFRVVIQDDQRSVWDLSGDRLGIVTQTVPGFRLGGGPCALSLLVPAGTKEFRIRLLGVHPAPMAARRSLRTARSRRSTRMPTPARRSSRARRRERWIPAARTRHARHQPAPADTGKVWSLVLWAAMDLGCELEGVPPYLAHAAGGFDPGADG